MNATFDPETVPVLFNMDLANAPTGERFCYEAAAVLGREIEPRDAQELLVGVGEFYSDIIDEWTSALDDAGYYVHWDAGDVVVFDLRNLSDDDRETFFDTFQ